MNEMRPEPRPVTFKLDLDLRNYLWEVKTCTGCAMCKYGDWTYVPSAEEYDFSWICPEWEWGVMDHYGTTGRVKTVGSLLMGDLPVDYPTIKEVAYRCHLCGGCEVSCKRNLDLEILMMHEALLVHLVNAGVGPMPQHKVLAEKIKRTGNYFGEDAKDRMTWAKEGVNVSQKADLLYFVGCYAAYKYPLIARSVTKILDAAQVPFMLMEEQSCCGYKLFSTGLLSDVRAAAKNTITKINDLGVSQVVTECADCYRMLKVEYPKVLEMNTRDLGFEVLHIAEYADRLIKDGAIKPRNEFPEKVAYHDPCSLGRLSEPWITWEGIRDAEDWGKLKPRREFRRGTAGCYKPPRDILRAIPGTELIEMRRHHHNAVCSGSCGGVREAFPKQQSFVTDVRVREANYVGAETIVTANPRTFEVFDESLTRMKKGGMSKNIAEVKERFAGVEKSVSVTTLNVKRVRDLAVLLASAI
ncbi:MAG: (Fe-S)-binding protein [Thermodesulfobacteriota bacterium]|nr:(Fe-S)-binding protein [Thermodesulfobacteriota bacterium]